MQLPPYSCNKIKEKIAEFFKEEEIETLARQSGFMQRKRALSGSSFLLLSMFDQDSLNTSSLNGLCTNLKEYGVEMRKQSLHNRFNPASVSFLKLVVSKLLSLRLAPIRSTLKGLDFFGRVLILDSTSFQLPDRHSSVYKGCGGDASEAGIKIHLRYNLKAIGELDFEIQSAATSDKQNSIMYSDIRSSDLYMEDLGYCKFDRLELIDKLDAYYLSRLAANTMLYQQAGNEVKELDICAIIKSMKPAEVREYYVLVSRTHLLPARLVLEKLPAHIVNEKVRKFREKQAHRGRKIKHKSLLFKTVNAYVTNVPADELPKETARKLYSLRWQIEMIFKTWKSHYHIHQVKETKLERFESYLYGKLLLILLHMKIYQVFRTLLWNNHRIELSEIKAFQVLIASSYKLKAMLIPQKRTYPDLLANLFEILHLWCRKEKRRGRQRPIEVIQTLFG